MTATQDTGKYRTNLNDQFYTKDGKAKHCVDRILEQYPDCASASWLWIEPSAGKGAFLKALPPTISRIGLDLDPKGPSILQGDYLTWTPPSAEKYLIFGNPPFGRQSSMAKTFIKRAATYADIIAFILPRSFKKPSMNRAFPLNFHLDYSIDLDANSFEVNGEDYAVPCVFQIWKKQSVNRLLEKPASEIPVGFHYKKASESYDLVIRRVGGKAGTAYLPPGDFNPQCHYYISLANPHCVVDLQTKINRHVFPNNTTGPRSLSKSEITRVVNAILINISGPTLMNVSGPTLMNVSGDEQTPVQEE